MSAKFVQGPLSWDVSSIHIYIVVIFPDLSKLSILELSLSSYGFNFIRCLHMSLDGSTDWHLLSLVHILQTKHGHTGLLWRETISSWWEFKDKVFTKGTNFFGASSFDGIVEKSIYLRYVVGNDQLLRKVYKGQGWNNWAASGRGCVVHCLHLFLLSGKTRAESTIPAPLKIHIEPENHPIKKENNRPNLHFWVPPSEATKLCSWPYRNIWLDKWNSRYFNKGFLAYYRVGWGLYVFRIIMTVWNFIDV